MDSNYSHPVSDLDKQEFYIVFLLLDAENELESATMANINSSQEDFRLEFIPIKTTIPASPFVCNKTINLDDALKLMNKPCKKIVNAVRIEGNYSLYMDTVF